MLKRICYIISAPLIYTHYLKVMTRIHLLFIAAITIIFCFIAEKSTTYMNLDIYIDGYDIPYIYTTPYSICLHYIQEFIILFVYI